MTAYGAVDNTWRDYFGTVPTAPAWADHGDVCRCNECK